MNPISANGFGGLYELQREDGSPVCMSDTVVSDQDLYTVTGGRAPHKPSSSGFVQVSGPGFNCRELYASVFRLVWVKR